MYRDALHSRRWLIVAAAAVGIALCGAPVADATAPGRDGRIAAVVERSDACFGFAGCVAFGWTIVSTEPDGSDRRAQPRQWGGASAIEYSADGSRLLVATATPPSDLAPRPHNPYRGIVTGPAGGPVNQPVRTRQPGRVFASPTAGKPSWTPDGKLLISVVGPKDGEIPDRALDLRRVTLRNSQYEPLRTLWDGEGAYDIRDAAISPDGNTLAVLYIPEPVDNRPLLRLSNVDGSNPRLLRVNQGAVSLEWAPDSQRIALPGITYDDNSGGMSVWNVSTGTETRLPVLGSEISWSPSGTAIAYTTRREIKVVNADGTNDRSLLKFAGGYDRAGPGIHEAAVDVTWQPRP